MSSLGKAILICSIIALLFAGAFFSVSPVLAEKAVEPGMLSAETTEKRADQTLILEAKDLSAAEFESSLSQSVGAAETQGGVAFTPYQFSDTQIRSDLTKDSSRQIKEVAENAEDVLLSSEPRANLSALQSFIDSVSTGSREVAGIYVSEDFSLNVGQQPNGSPGYITGNSGEVTQFGLAADYGSKGFLAHNYLSGNSFFDLSVGMNLTLVYGDGTTESYVIEEIRQFEALQPNSPNSNFVDMDAGGKLSATKLFHSIFNGNNPVVLQTCIANQGISTWGRLFIIAVPVAS